MTYKDWAVEILDRAIEADNGWSNPGWLASQTAMIRFNVPQYLWDDVISEITWMLYQ
jgi:hypothetical protein